MNLTALNHCFNPSTIFENELVSGIFEILNACEGAHNLMIGIYLPQKNHFLYINRRLRKIVGENGIKLLNEGWRFWYSIIDKKEVGVIKDKVTHFLSASDFQKPLTLSYHITNFEGKRVCLKHELVLHLMKKETLAINYLFDVSDKERIEYCLANNNYLDDNHCSNKLPIHVTTREREILHLIANGFSSKEIADRLFISNHTAVSHRKNLIEKFQVKNTAHLIKKASEIIPL